MNITPKDIRAFNLSPTFEFVYTDFKSHAFGGRNRLNRLVELSLIEKTDMVGSIQWYKKADVTDACCKCGWVGKADDKQMVQANDGLGGKIHSCPRCLHDEFYVLGERC